MTETETDESLSGWRGYWKQSDIVVPAAESKQISSRVHDYYSCTCTAAHSTLVKSCPKKAILGRSDFGSHLIASAGP